MVLLFVYYILVGFAMNNASLRTFDSPYQRSSFFTNILT